MHLAQLGYNAQGQDIANNLYAYLRTEVEVKDVTLYNITTNTQGVKMQSSVTTAEGRTYKLAIVCDPVPASDLEITVEGPLKLESPFVVTVTGTGTGTLTVKHGDKVLKTVTFNAK